MSVLGKGFRYNYSIRTPGGLILPRPPVQNLVPLEGIQFVADLIIGTGTSNSNWYAFLFEGNYLPDGNASAADLPGIIGECTAYSNVTRPTWGPAFDGVSTIVNPVDVEFVMTADKILYGAGIVSASTKASGSGFILSIARFPSPEEIKTGATFTLTADLPILSTDI